MAGGEREPRDLNKELQKDADIAAWEDAWQDVDEQFFKDADFIRKGSQEYFDFKEFFFKLVKVKKARGGAGGEPRPAVPEEERQHIQQRTGVDVSELPSRYDPRYRINFSVLAEPPPSARSSDAAAGRRRRRQLLTDEQTAEMRRALALFADFRQKKVFAKLHKVRVDQRNLPIFPYKEQILAAVAANPVIVIAGDTGCGKSTQVPQYLLQAGYNKIACTQPRRISAIALCRRVSHETFNGYGSSIAFQIRFDSTKTADTRILFLTEGLLLRQIASDPQLARYDVVIIDEVHERHITGDFLLAILRDLIMRRPGLKIICMSATINVNLFSSYFHNAPIIQIPGRLFPIKLEYVEMPRKEEFLDERLQKGSLGKRPAHIAETAKHIQQKAEPTVLRRTKRSGRGGLAGRSILDVEPYIKVLSRIDQQYPPDERGDVLVFLSGINEIMALVDEVRGYAAQNKRWIVLPLHSSLSVEEQDKVFDVAPDGVRKCIVSTNIAETSVTIDGVRFVVDSGKAKEMAYDADTRVNSLQEFWVSRASADQRKGRAGRTGPGHCFRMYSETEYTHFLEYNVAEIHRVSLDGVVLEIKALGLGDPRDFPFIEPPQREAVEATVMNLKRLQALASDQVESLTPLGHVLARLPVDVQIGKMLVLATIFQLVDPVLTIAAALSVQSPFLRITDSSESSMERRHEFDSEHGDPFTLLHAFDEWVQVKAGQRESSKKWAKRHFIEEQRLYEMSKLKQQFHDILVDAGLLKKEGGEDGAGDWDEGPRPAFEFDEYGHPRPRSRSSRDAGREKDRERIAKRRQLRILQMQRETERGRRVLSLEEHFPTEEGPANADEAEAEKEDWETEDVDIRHMDFLLSHDLDQLVQTSQRTLTLEDINLIKIILSSGLYPHVAIADEGNVNRPDSDLVFHTRFKPQVFMHPTSIYSTTAGVAAPKEGKPQSTGGSDGHELYSYVSLLETNKTYLTNCTRLPALHATTLLAHSIDTDEACTRFLVDNWLEFTVASPKVGERLLAVVHQLRLMLSGLLARRLSKAAADRERQKRRGAGRGGPRFRQRRWDDDEAQAYEAAQEVEEEQAAAAADAAAPPAFVAPPPDYRVPEGIEVPGIIRRIAREWTDAGPLLSGQPDATGATRPLEDRARDEEGEDEAAAAAAAAAEGGPPAALFAGEDELSRKLAGFLELSVPFKMERLAPAVVAALFGVTEAAVAAEASLSECAMGNLEAAAAVSGTGAGVEGAAQLEDMKRGWKAAEWLRWGSLRSSREAKALAGISAHLRKHWECPSCKKRLIVNLTELKEHRAQCASNAPAPKAPPRAAAAAAGGSAVVAAARAMRGEPPPPPMAPPPTKRPRPLDGGGGKAEGEEKEGGAPAAGRRRWECPACLRGFVFTPVESLRHQRSCTGAEGT